MMHYPLGIGVATPPFNPGSGVAAGGSWPAIDGSVAREFFPFPCATVSNLLERMMIDRDGQHWVELKEALYGPGGLFADIRMRDARRLFSRIIRRKSRGGFMVRYVPSVEVAKLHVVIADGTF